MDLSEKGEFNQLVSSAKSGQSKLDEAYKIEVTDVADFRRKLITLIEQLIYYPEKYDAMSSSQIAESFERSIQP